MTVEEALAWCEHELRTNPGWPELSDIGVASVLAAEVTRLRADLAAERTDAKAQRLLNKTLCDDLAARDQRWATLRTRFDVGAAAPTRSVEVFVMAVINDIEREIPLESAPVVERVCGTCRRTEHATEGQGMICEYWSLDNHTHIVPCSVISFCGMWERRND